MSTDAISSTRSALMYEALRKDLAPSQWIWFPSERTLPNTFVLFRRELALSEQPRRAQGWISADSRYRLTVNGQRIQWGPAPCDPRWLEADPIDLTAHLQPGSNVLGVEVLYYGLGDGTWVTGKPGLLFSLEIEYADGRSERVISDPGWLTYLDRAHRPGQYKRWFLRALQEDFDARLHPYGWDTPTFTPDQRWQPAFPLNVAANVPPLTGSYRDYLAEAQTEAKSSGVLARQIPLLREITIPALCLRSAGRLLWRRDPADWFEFRVPGAYEIQPEPLQVEQDSEQTWTLPATPTEQDAHYVTYEFAEQIVGWPYFTIDAPEGTIIELIQQESHDPERTAWLDNHFFSWSRFTCREGINRFEAFDFESLRWLQLHIRNAHRPVTISAVGVRRRLYDWPHEPYISCDEAPLQRLFTAGINTFYNSAQETCVDGMGRERQQYSGDGGHQLHAFRYLCGEVRLSQRFLRTYSEGITPDGYFLDCWPAADRMTRLGQRTVQATAWGPMLDHSVGFAFDCWHHYLENGDLQGLHIPYPRLLRFATYLEQHYDEHGLLPVENLGIPTVWIDHDAYQQQRHKQCAFNLYAAAMLQHALAPIARALGDAEHAEQCMQQGRQLLAATVRRFWSPEHGCFVCNLPWLDEEQHVRLCDRSLATSILFNQCPDGAESAAVQALVECPKEMGLSYPANAGWRYWALARAGHIGPVLHDLRTRWATMASVLHNNTLQEFWEVQPDSTAQWSHCAVVPLYILCMDIAGIRPTAPGFAQYQVRPQLGDLGEIALRVHTAYGPIEFTATPVQGGHHVTLRVPPIAQGELLLPAGSPEPDLPRLLPDHPRGLWRFKLEPDQIHSFRVSSYP